MWDYVVLLFKETKDGHKLTTLIVLALLELISFVAPTAQGTFLGFGGNDVVLFMQKVVVVVWVLIAFVWVPARVHARQKATHAAEIGAAEDRIRELEDGQSEKLLVICDPQNSKCRIFHEERSRPSVFLRTAIKNTSPKPVTGCRPFLVSVRKDGVVLMENETRQLGFTPRHLDSGGGKTILPSQECTLDVLTVSDRRDVWTATVGDLNVERTHRGDPVFRALGEYDLVVSIYADNCAAVQVQLSFNWTGDYKTSTLRRTE